MLRYSAFGIAAALSANEIRCVWPESTTIQVALTIYLVTKAKAHLLTAGFPPAMRPTGVCCIALGSGNTHFASALPYVPPKSDVSQHPTPQSTTNYCSALLYGQ